MALETRVTDKRFVTSYVEIRRLDNNTLYTSVPTGYSVGSFKRIVSERAGKFIPGDFRFNPCDVVTCEAGPDAVSTCNTVWHYHRGHLSWLAFNKTFSGNNNTWPYVGFNLLGLKPLDQMYGSNTVNRAKATAFESLKTPQAEVGVFLAEFTETLRMLKNPLDTLRKLCLQWFMKASKYKRLKKKISFSEALAATWLEYRYGILPLVSDISSFIDLATGKKERYGFMRFRGRCDENFSQTVKGTYVGGTYYFGYEADVTQVCKTKVTSHLAAIFDGSTIESPWNKVGLSPFDVLRVGYELVPFSFVLDWWFDVGTWLTNLRDVPCTFKGGGYTVRQSCRLDVRCTALYDYVRKTRHPSNSAPATIAWERLVRVVDPTVPSLPAFNFDFNSWKHLIDITSIGYTMLKSLKQIR